MKVSPLKFEDHLQIRWANVLWKPAKGPERKSDCAASIGGRLPSQVSPVDFRKAPRGRQKKALISKQDTPATAKRGSVPHDCKQYDFPSGTLESLDLSKKPAL